MRFDEEEAVDELVNHLDCSVGTSLLSGAGISLRAGVPSANQIVEKLAAMYEDVNTEMEYAEAWNTALPGSENAGKRRSLIEGWITGRPPISGVVPPPESDERSAGNHYLVAQLVETGYLDSILTTNFDHLHE